MRDYFKSPTANANAQVSALMTLSCEVIKRDVCQVCDLNLHMNIDKLIVTSGPELLSLASPL